MIAYNLSRAAGVLADGKLGNARSTTHSFARSTIRTTLINITHGWAFSAQAYTLRLAANSRRELVQVTLGGRTSIRIGLQ